MTTAAEDDADALYEQVQALPPGERLVADLLICAVSQEDEARAQAVQTEMEALSKRTDLSRSRKFEEAWNIIQRDIEQKESAAIWQGEQ